MKSSDTLPLWVRWMPWIALLAFVLLSVAYWVKFSPFGSSSDPASWGQFGDYIGGLLNPLVATLALLALAYSIKIQRQELSETRSALEKQIALDNAFSLLQQHRELVSAVSVQVQDQAKITQKSSGRDAFSMVVSHLQSEASSDQPEVFARSSADTARFTLASLASFVPQLWFVCWYRSIPCRLVGAEKELPFTSSLEASFGHIFRSTYQTLKFIYHLNDSLFDAQAKLSLVNYLRAQMSEDEFVLLALSALTEEGQKSRAIAIAFDFFGNRMLHQSRWITSMRTLFEPTPDNTRWAKEMGYERVI